MLRPGRCFLPKSKDEGFTLVEVLTVIAVVMILGLVFWIGVSGGIQLIKKIQRTAHYSIKLLGTDDYIRTMVSKIKFPFWLSSLEIDENEEPLLIPYFMGMSGNYLSIQYEDNYLTIGNIIEEEEEPSLGSSDSDSLEEEDELSEVSLTLGPYKRVSYFVVYDEEERPLGIEFNITVEEGGIGNVTIYTRLQGHPLWKEED